MQAPAYAPPAPAPRLRHGFYRIPEAAGIWSVQGGYMRRDGRLVLADDLSHLATGAQSEAEAERLVRSKARRRGWRQVEIHSLERQPYVYFLTDPTPAAAADLGITAADWLPEKPEDFWGTRQPRRAIAR